MKLYFSQRYLSILLLLFALVGCNSHYLKVAKVPFDGNSLASTFARSPDPLQSQNLKGEKLYISWKVPVDVDPKGCEISLQIIYKDLSEEVIKYPLSKRLGTFGFPLIGEKYQETNGFYSYKAEIVNKEGEILDSWQHLMWVNILNL